MQELHIYIYIYIYIYICVFIIAFIKTGVHDIIYIVK